MSNFLYHNKWHGFNHHTIPTEGFPDSAIDPIASDDYPFKGIFYNVVPLSASEEEKIFFTAYYQDSFGWYRYTSLTYTYSADWNLWSSVRNTASGVRLFYPRLGTVTFYYENWNSGFQGYSYWIGNSAKIYATYLNTLALSSEAVWPLSTEGRSFPISGRGWHIALSAITLKLNVSGINTRQKNAIPSPLTYNANSTLFWDVSTAQTAYLTLTENRTITATRIFNAHKGGKYTMWVALDFCPTPAMNMVFHPDTYRIQVVKYPRTDSYFSNLSVIRLLPNNITRIDFVYDGRMMLGKATHYRIFLPTTDDTYYEGLGNELEPNPWFVNGLSEPNSYIAGGNGIVIKQEFTRFTEVSAIYISGSGVDIVYFGQDFNFFNFNLIGAQWQTESTLTRYPSLTASFDRVYGNLSAANGGDYNDRRFAQNLFATPAITTAPDVMLSAYPNPPYVFTKFKLIPIPQCLSALNVRFASAKDRDIKRIIVNRGAAGIAPPIVGGLPQKYNFNNERQGEIVFERVQSNTTFDVYFEKQAPVNGVTPALWFDFIDQNTTTLTSNTIDRITSKPDVNYFLSQSTPSSKPELCQTTIFRSARFTTAGGKTTFMTLNRPVTAIDPAFGGNVEFTTFTVVEPTTIVNNDERVIWWMGDYNYGTSGTAGSRGYGVVLSGNRICFGGIGAPGFPKFSSQILDYEVQVNKPFVLTTVVQQDPIIPARRTSIFYINGRRLSFASGHNRFIFMPLSNFNIVYGRVPGQNKFTNAKLHAHILYKGAISESKILTINNYLINKYYIVEGYNSSSC